ncbi:MAG TPA: ABC transporter ATP-binding protein [Thermoanaerobacterales bacterium]|nr:ABC transporter ATP-binding protein [Thermoanaerobacterales bacterium]
MENNILEIINLSKTYGNFKLSDVNISLPRGYIMGFIGANGAGKTTTIKLIMNMIKKDSGEIRVFGKDHVKYELYIKNKVGYVSEQPVFYENQAVAWNVNFAKKFYDEWDDALFEDLLTRFNIDSSKKINQLSKGMRMKTALAIALSHHPELLILDEPTSGLDPIVRDELLGILMEFIQDESRSVFFSSHITSDIEKIGDYVTFIDNGRIILSEEKDKILDKWKIVKGDINLMNNYKKDLIGLEQTRTYFKALVKDFDAFKAKYDISSLVIDKPTLDDVLLHLTKKENLR